jgi:hypothetical protein
VSRSDAQVRPFLTALRDRWWIVALCTVTAFLLTFAVVKKQPGQFQASTLLGLSNSYIDRDIFELSRSQESVEAKLAQQPGQLDTATAAYEFTKRLGLQPAIDGRRIQANTSVELDPKYFIPVVHGRSNNPVTAAKLANGFAQVVMEERHEKDQKRLDKAIYAERIQLSKAILAAAKVSSKADEGIKQQANGDITRLTSKVLRLRLLKEFRPKSVRIVRWASVPTTRTRPPALNLAIFGGLFGAMMGCALLAWREQRDRRPRPAEVLRGLRAAILTDLPRSALLPGARPRGPRDEELAALDAVRRVVQADREQSAVAVTEAINLGRASALARLLAETAALAGSHVLLATNDSHNKTNVEGLDVAEYPIEVGAVARDWLDAQRAAYDLVVMDLPSPVGSAAGLELASLADSVIAVWLPDSIDRRQLTRLGRALSRSNITLDGVVRIGGQEA